MPVIRREFFMAIIPGLKKVGPYWHFNLKINGKRAHGSTRATDLATARKILEEKRRELLEGQHRIVSRIPTLNDLYDLWRRNHQAVFSQKHLVSVDCIYRKWLRPRFGASKIDQIGASAVDSLRSEVITLGRSPRYANNILQVLRLLLNYGVKTGSIKELPIKIRMSRIQRKPRYVLPVSRVQEFFSAVDRSARNPHVRVMVRVMVGLGLRESEALGMRWAWFDAEGRSYVVGKAKGFEARVIPVPTWVFDAILSMPKNISEWVFPAKDGKPHRSQFCKKVIFRVCTELGMEGITAHRLRASFATNLELAGAPVTAIQEMLGHKDLKTTRGYLETSMESKRRAQDALSERLGLAVMPPSLPVAAI